MFFVKLAPVLLNVQSEFELHKEHNEFNTS